MSRLILILSFIITLSSCRDKNSLPAGILPQEKMQEITWDLIRAGEFLNAFVLFKDTSLDKGMISQKWYDRVYDIHKVTKEQYDKSYAYYREHPVIMKRLLDSLARKEYIVKEDSTKYGQAPVDTLNRSRLIPDPSAIRPDTFRRRKRLDKKPLLKEVQ